MARSAMHTAALRLGMAGAWLCAACTLSNTSEGGTEGVERPMGRDNPAPESVAVFVQPGENLLSALGQIEDYDSTAVLPRNSFVLGLALSELGAYRSAALAFQPANTPFPPQTMQCLMRTLPDAVEEICNVIRGGSSEDEEDTGPQLVFIDDTPHFAQQRRLGREILPCAREAGFEYLVVEALAEGAEALRQRGYVSRSRSGPFVREPQLAGILEDGLALGFTPVALPADELCSDCTLIEALSQSSEAKADSLIAQTLAVNPEAKVLVWAQSGQAFEQRWGPRPFVNSLAAVVFSRTEINPYTIVQAVVPPGTDLGPAVPSGMFYASGPVNGSCSGSYSPGSATGLPTHDAVVLHVPPREASTVQGDVPRWEWLHAPEAERMRVTAQCASCAAGERLLVQALPAGIDSRDRVASDQALCLPGSECQLVLPAGSYQLVVWSETTQVGTAEVDLLAATPASVSL